MQHAFWAGPAAALEPVEKESDDRSALIPHEQQAFDPPKSLNTSPSGDPTSLRRISLLLTVIVIAIILTFCYLASSFCIAVLLSALVAILIDPIVVKMETAGLGRGVASCIVVIGLVLVVGGLTYKLYSKADSFIGALPNYSYRLREAVEPLVTKVESLQSNVEKLKSPREPEQAPEVRISQSPDWSSLLVRGVGSVWSALVIAAVVPFLAFFMLIRKQHMYVRFMNIFEGKIDANRFMRNLHDMVRGYILGSLLVGATLSVATCSLFLVLGMNGAVPLGVVCGFLNIVPFFGIILAMALALAAAILQFSAVAPFIVLVVMLPLLHLIATNLLIPRFVGSRILVGPVAITAGILFWGWLWGAAGLILAVPLTAFIKIIADSHPSLVHLSNILAEEPRPLPRWMHVGGRTLHRFGPYLRPRVRPRRSDR